MQGQRPSPMSDNPTKTIHLWRIHRDLLARGKMPPVDASSGGKGFFREKIVNCRGGFVTVVPPVRRLRVRLQVS